MFKFKYKAVDVNGKISSDYIIADSKAHAEKLLTKKGLKPAEITLISKTSHSKQGADDAKLQKQLSGAVALPFLTRLLQLHGSGMPIGDTLKILQSRLKDNLQRNLAVGLWRELSEGKGIADAMKKYPKVFSDDIICPIDAAEATGNLVPVLTDVIKLLEEREALKKKIIAGMAYPAFVSIMAIVVVGFFLFFLLPKIEHMLLSLGGQLTLPAKVLVGMSQALLYGIPALSVAAVIGWIMIGSLRKKSLAGRIKTDLLLLKIPYVGNVMRYIEICRVSNLMSTLLGSGVNLTEAMRLTERAIHNLHMRQIFQDARSKINDGVALPVAFKTKTIPFFTDLAIDILTVGESTGNMHESLREVYKLHNIELDAKLRFMTNFITSAALGFAFMLVGVLALGIVSSIMQFSNSLKF